MRSVIEFINLRGPLGKHFILIKKKKCKVYSCFDCFKLECSDKAILFLTLVLKYARINYEESSIVDKESRRLGRVRIRTYMQV